MDNSIIRDQHMQAKASAAPEALQPDAPFEFHATPADHKEVYPILDGWRGISILLVLAAHMLPVGPTRWAGNWITGVMAMSLFFTLSGFLITTTLLKNPSVRTFLIRRLTRIVPLAIAGALVALVIQRHTDPLDYLAYIFFFGNYRTEHVTALTEHFWSLSVEVHFYVFIALLVAVLGRRGLKLLPWFCLGITGYRIATGHWIGIRTEQRVDEILAGTIVALIHHGEIWPGVKRAMRFVWYPLLIAALFLCSAPQFPWLNYARPYAGASLVACTLWYPPRLFGRILSSAFLGYVATISYALYVLHQFPMLGWLGTGHAWQKYLLKRPISFVLVFLLAHISTFYYERPWTEWGKRITRKKRSASKVKTYPPALAQGAPAMANPGGTVKNPS